MLTRSNMYKADKLNFQIVLETPNLKLHQTLSQNIEIINLKLHQTRHYIKKPAQMDPCHVKPKQGHIASTPIPTYNWGTPT